MLPYLLSASLLYNTYYPVSLSGSLKTDKNVIQYANCNWINNRCLRPIEKEYPDIIKYDHISINELDVNADDLFKMMLRNNLMIPMDFCIFKNKHHIVVDNMNDHGYEIIATPLTHNRTRLFIFTDKTSILPTSSIPL